MKTQFLLEQQIMDCWNIINDIKSVYQHHLDVQALTDDQLANVLIGIEQLYDLKFYSLFSTFEKYLKEVHDGRHHDV